MIGAYFGVSQDVFEKFDLVLRITWKLIFLSSLKGCGEFIILFRVLLGEGVGLCIRYVKPTIGWAFGLGNLFIGCLFGFLVLLTMA